MSYSQALETQLQLLGLFAGVDGLRFARYTHETKMMHFGAAPSVADIQRAAIWDLERAETFYLAPDIVDILDRVATTLPPDARPSQALLPHLYGYVHFGRPIRLRSPTDCQWCGFSWAFYAECGPEVLSEADVDWSKAGIEVMWYEQSGGSLIPFAFDTWPFTEPCSGWTPHDPDAPNAAAYRADSEQTRRFLLAFLHFVQQRIMTAEPQRAERATRKRVAQRWDVEPVVRVVQLRRHRARQNDEHDARVVDWACQWIVDGHWAKRRCGKDHANARYVYIAPYVKGPPDKPLRTPRATVFAVVR